MTSRLSTIATLLMVGAALAASPALAASDKLEPNPGTPDLSVTREAPVVLPQFTPRPTPTLDRPSVSRGIFDELDEEMLLESLGTATWHPGGEVDNTGPSDALKAVFDAQIKNHQ